MTFLATAVVKVSLNRTAEEEFPVTNDSFRVLRSVTR